MNHDNAADDMAHKRFRGDFDKLFGAKPPMRKVKSEAPGEVSRILIALEKLLTAMAEPARIEKRAALAKALAEGAALRAQAQSLIAEFRALQAEVERLKKRREEAQARVFHARPFALDVNDPRVVEFIGEAIRANPGLLDRIAKPH